MKLLRCRMNGSNVTNFTDGKVYKASPGPGSLLMVIDDLGISRYVIPNEPSPHLVKQERIDIWPGWVQASVGRFEEVA